MLTVTRMQPDFPRSVPTRNTCLRSQGRNNAFLDLFRLGRPHMLKVPKKEQGFHKSIPTWDTYLEGSREETRLSWSREDNTYVESPGKEQGFRRLDSTY